MSDKNFKVKNGIDSTGPVTITTPNTSTTGLIINVPAGGKSISFLRDGIERASIDDWGSFTTNSINVVQPWWVRSPGIDTQSFFWVGSGSRSSVGIAGTNSGTNPVVYISQNGTATNDLTQWIKPDNTILAKIDYLGSIYNSGLVEIGRTKTSDGSSAINFITVGSYAGAGGQSTISRGSGYNGSLVLTNYGNGSIILNQGGTNILTITNTGSATFSSDLTVTGNFTVNGTTTNLNSTNLVVEDKNIIIADVTTPTDTTADGAGITIKGATDKTLNWVQSTSSFTSSDPFIINTNSTTIPNLILKQIASQTADLQQWQNSSGTVLSSISSNGNLVSNLSGTSTTFPIFVYTTSSLTTPYGIAVARQNRSDQYIHIHESDGSKAVIEAVAPNAAKPFFIKNKSNEALYLGTNDTNRFSITSTGLIGVGIDTPSSAQMTLINSNSANTGLLIKGAASQTANLQEWQDSSGSVITRIGPNGHLLTTVQLSATSALTAGTSNYLSASLNVIPLNASIIGAVIRRVTSQTADLMQWQDQSGGILGTINKDGAITLNSSTSLGAALSAYTSWSGATGIIVKGSTSQTANLQEWQNSSGTVLAGINNIGQISTIYGVYTGSASFAGVSWNGISNPTGVTTLPSLVVKGIASQTANLQEWQDSGGTTLAYVRDNGYSASIAQFAYIYTSAIQGWNGAGGSISFANALPIIITPQSASTVVLAIKGAASQSANLQEWQNSSGTALSYIKSNGSFYVVGNSNTTWISGPSTSGTNQIVSNGNDLAFSPFFDGLFAPANSSGRWRPVNDATSDLGTSGQRWKDLYATASVLTNNSASKVGLIVKGAASQTANLQEWQNNSGTVLAKIDKDGIITVPAINVVGQSISSNTTMIAGYRYFVDTSASRTLTLPSSATIGDEIQIFDSTNTAGTNNITINSNNGKIEGVVESYIIDVNGAAIVMTYTGSTYGWKVRM